MLKTNFQEELNNELEQFKIIDDDPDKYRDFCYAKQNHGKTEMISYQKIIEYLMIEKDFRGLLIYFGLGSGKTLTALNVAEKLLISKPKKIKSVIIICPASLRYEFYKEIFKHYIEKYPSIESASVNYTFLSYNSPTFVEQYRRLAYNLDIADSERLGINNLIKKMKNNTFDERLVIIDEAHEFFKRVISANAKQSAVIFNEMIRSKNSKYLFLTGTPIIGTPFEISPMFNILKGRLKNNSELFPSDYDYFNDLFVDNDKNSIKNEDIFKDRITGLVSYYRGFKDEKQYVIPKKLGMEVIRCKMGEYQFYNYFKVRQEELELERRTKYAKDNFKQTRYKKAGRESKGVHKVKSRQVCNFGFPDKLLEKITEQKKDSKHIGDFKLTLIDFLNKTNELKTNLELYSGKYAKILELINNDDDFGHIKYDSKKNIISAYNVFIFSNFSVMGLRALAKILTINGWNNFESESINLPSGTETEILTNQESDFKRYIIIDGQTNPEFIKHAINVFNSPYNKNGRLIRCLLGSMVVSAGFNFYNIRKVIIMESQWRNTTIDQTIGRAIRLCSHKELPVEERTVKPYLLLSNCPPDKRKNLIGDNGLTSDEIIFNKSNDIDQLNSSFIKIIKESAVDCTTNNAHNIDVETCHVCEDGDDQTELIIPDVKEHIISGSKCVKKIKNTSVNLIKIIYNDEEFFIDGEDNVYRKMDEEFIQVGMLINNQIKFF